ncbi:MAG: cryptochrome/photolyase family protein [Alphaproteobacteria bacterium]|nr:cryptochrome/photolyase family protein [Alphaproteobacteria bacterium]
MTTLRFVLGDQLTRDISSLRDATPGEDIVLMAEVMEEATYVRHHKQKIAFLFSAMRHFADALRAEGFDVRYIRLDEEAPCASFTDALMSTLSSTNATCVIVTEPGEYRVLEMMRSWEAMAPAPVEIRSDDRFYCSIDDFRRWERGKSSYRLEYFYRDLRRRFDVLMDGADPVGGRWNFDAENRKPWPKKRTPPKRIEFAPDRITKDVLALVAGRFPDHFGDIEAFGWAVTRDDALVALQWFIANALPDFGDHQDAMLAEAPFLYHSMLSPYLNAGLLTAREVVDAAVNAHAHGAVPLHAVEGFVRQILGWREYVRGVYWSRMPEYALTNVLGGDRPLPWFYWSGETDMACVRDVVAMTRRYAYAHHIQRLMVTGALGLLWGVRPAELEEWYLAVYADAFEWVELPNVHGMALYADGGALSSKPYAAGGAYINRMSNYCGGCRFDPKKRTGEDACPFTTLYWDFLMRQDEKLSGNIRLAMPYRALANFSADERAAIRARADAVRDGTSPV